MKKLFFYTAYNSEGIKKTGQVSATDAEDAKRLLRAESLIPVKVIVDTDMPKPLFGGSSKVSASSLEQSTRQLALLLSNGLRIDKALDVLSKSAKSDAIGTIWRKVNSHINEGKELHKALAEYPAVFDPLYIEMVKIGESTGALPEIFNRLGDNIQFQNGLKKKVIQASVYPAFIFVVCILAIFAIFNFVIPSMSSVFASLESLPGYTQFLLSASDWVVAHQGKLILGVASVVMLTVWALNNHERRQRFLSVCFTLPWIRSIVRKVDRIRFSTGMSLTLSSGLNLSSALTLSANTVLSDRLKSELRQFAEKVSAGQPISSAIEKVQLYDDISLSLISVGEESGALSDSFKEITNINREQLESWLLRLTVLLEPLLILVMGGIVGSVVITMLLSIVSINDVSF